VELTLNRWLFTPRGCAIFYVPFRNQHLIRTCLPTSHGYQYLSAPPGPTCKTPFVHLFEFVTTIDYTPYICIHSALDFRKRICGGEEEIRKYCWEMARVGGKRVAEVLGTEVLDNKTEFDTMLFC
jgi:selenocysteine lyase/cysteine desulfurase